MRRPINAPLLDNRNRPTRRFVHSFVHSISIAPYQFTTTQRRSRLSTDIVSEFHAKVPQATASKELTQGPYVYVAARAGIEPTRPFGQKAPNLPMSHHAP